MRFCLPYLWASSLFSIAVASQFLPLSLSNPLGSPSSGSNSNNGLRACERLRTSLGSEVVQFSSGPDYLTSASGAWNLFNAQSRPKCIVYPRDASQVQTTMTAIFQYKVRYAVQAGSHSAMAGWNTVEDGILIYFSHMKNISYDSVKHTITLQPGIHWGEAIAQLAPFGVAPLGGRLPDVGTGLLLGGGLSYLSGEYGFSCDAYVELDVVLVNGTLVTATANNQHASLFRSLKGGANRFGIVTRYVVDAIPTGVEKNWFGGLILYPNSSTEALLQATQKYVRTVTDPKASILMVFSQTINGTVITPLHILTLFYHGSSLPQNIFGDFLAIPSTFQQLSPVTYLEANHILGLGADRGYGQIFGASALSANVGVDAYRKSHRLWQEYAEQTKDIWSGAILAFTPVLDSQIQIGRSKGGNVIHPPRGNYAAIQVHTQTRLGQTTVPRSFLAARERLFKKLPYTKGLPLYVAESDKTQKVFETYGRYEEMKRTYAKYDPTRFNVRFTDGPIGL